MPQGSVPVEQVDHSVGDQAGLVRAEFPQGIDVPFGHHVGCGQDVDESRDDLVTSPRLVQPSELVFGEELGRLRDGGVTVPLERPLAFPSAVIRLPGLAIEAVGIQVLEQQQLLVERHLDLLATFAISPGDVQPTRRAQGSDRGHRLGRRSLDGLEEVKESVNELRASGAEEELSPEATGAAPEETDLEANLKRVSQQLQQLDNRLKIADRKATTGRTGAARRGLSDAAKQAAVVAATRHRKADATD